MPQPKIPGPRITSPLLTVEEVSELLQVHTDTVIQWSDQGLLKTYRLGPRRVRRYRAEDLVDRAV
jgi:excisionase family DNA binding protein